jgi:hypothetical protein
VLARRLDAPEPADVLQATLAQAAAQGLAGVGVAGPGAAIAPFHEAARLADTLGLFLVACETA